MAYDVVMSAMVLVTTLAIRVVLRKLSKKAYMHKDKVTKKSRTFIEHY